MINLPYEMLLKIARNSTLKEISSLSKTCKSIRNDTYNNSIFWNEQGKQRMGESWQKIDENMIEVFSKDPLEKFKFFKHWEDNATKILKKHRRGSEFDGIFNTYNKQDEKRIVQNLVETAMEANGVTEPNKTTLVEHIKTKLFN